MRTDILVIGAGASGMTAAIAAAGAPAGKSVLVLEKNEAAGKKIYATGNGRCNIMNSSCDGKDLVRDFFRSIGLEMKEEDEGRMYPMSEQASDVVFVLENALRERGVKVMTGTECRSAERTDGGFTVTAAGKDGNELKIQTGRLIIAAGGKAGPMYGCTGDGYRIARSLGHSTGRLAPALTGIETSGDMKVLKGTRTQAIARLLRYGGPVSEERGIVQFTDYGVSGICIFNLSRYILLDDNTNFDNYEISFDLLPDMEEADLISLLEWRKENVPGIDAAGLARSILPGALAETVCAGDPERTARNAKDMRLRVTGMRGWKMAQVTRGGISADEIDSATMESRIVPGLYFAGEITDYDGPCGGYNLCNAWLTGLKAGAAAGE